MEVFSSQNFKCILFCLLMNTPIDRQQTGIFNVFPRCAYFEFFEQKLKAPLLESEINAQRRGGASHHL